MSNEINGFAIDEFNVHDIPAKAKHHTCPKCSHTRKKDKEKCMSVFWDTGLGFCNHCNEITQLHTYQKKTQEVVYKRPATPPVNTGLSKRVLDYLTIERGFSAEAIKTLKIREQKEWMPGFDKPVPTICFDYYLNEELINVKYRGPKKSFKLVKDAERIFYNLDNIRTDKTCLIVEGEMDCLAFATAGYYNVVSVPNGFSIKNVNLDYLDGYTEFFENKETIYLAVDNDEAGRMGQKELIRRLGVEKCKVVDFGDCKDANDYLLKYGKEKLANLLATAKDVKFEGIYTAKDVRENIIDGWKNGQSRGTTTYIENVDPAWTWREGELNLWTGYQNEGKSLFLNQLCALRAYWEDAKVAVFSPENIPIKDFYDDIIEMFIGKSVDPYYKYNHMSEEELNAGIEFVEKNFFLIYPGEDFTIKSIFERTKFLIKKNGIRTLIVDPYNTVEHMMKPGEREDLYISRFMAQLKRFAVENHISVNLVAHQNTPKKNPNDGNRYYKPELNNVKGGGTFADKADNVLTVWRPNRALDFQDSEIIFASQKIKKQKLVGRPQEVNGDFDIRSNRYLFDGVSPFSRVDRKRLNIPEDDLPEEKPLPTPTASEAFGISDEDFENGDLPF